MTHEQFRANLSANLRKLKESERLSDANIAEAIGAPRRTISEWVNGTTTPNALDYCKLCAAFPKIEIKKKDIFF